MGIPGLSRKQLAGLLVAALVALATWFLQQQGYDDGDTTARDDTTASAPASPTPTYDDTAGGEDTGAGPGATDPHSGLPWVALEDLPPEAKETIALIEAGGPFPYDRDGITFENREGILPDEPEGYYREYTVPTPGEDDRGARRVVTGSEGEYYWTQDHYRSFERILR